MKTEKCDIVIDEETDTFFHILNAWVVIEEETIRVTDLIALWKRIKYIDEQEKK